MNVYVIGDIHGDFKVVRDFTQRTPSLHRNKSNMLICLGDFGGNYFFDDRDDKFKSKLNKYPFTYFVMRGNHEQRPSICMAENPSLWHIENYCGGLVYVENAHPHIKYAADVPAVYNINGARTLVLPGAYSVDKYHRLNNGWSWFQDEQLTPAEMEIGEKICEEDNRFDLILSHTCPIIYEPADLFLSCVNQSMVDKSMERYLGQMEYNLDYKLWCFGHYHADRFYPITDEGQMIMLFHKVLDLTDWTKNTNEYVTEMI